jgi:hypothetical protein
MPVNSVRDKDRNDRVPVEPCELPGDIQLVCVDDRGRQRTVALEDAALLGRMSIRRMTVEP